MPWVRVDDRFPSHRKIRLLSDRAFRLYVSALCWSSENLTDGLIPASELRIVADVRSSKSAAKELVERGLFENTDSGDFLIHDYLEYNPSSDQVRAERSAKTTRQARWRANKKTKKAAPAPPPQSPDVDASTPPSTDASVDGGVAPAPCPLPYPGTSPNGEVPPGRQRAGGIPDPLEPLRTALAANGLGAVAWDIRKITDWERIRKQMDRLGVELMVRSAVTAARQRGEPDSVTAWIGRWESLADPQPQVAQPQLPAPGGQVVSLTGTDARVAAHAELTARLRAAEAQESS